LSGKNKYNQSIKGSLWSYLGVVVGFVTTSYLFPNFLTTDTVGLFGLLLAWSVLFAQFASLGFHGVTSRLFPFFRNHENKHNGFLFIAFVVMIIGFVLFLILFWFLKSWLIETNVEKSKLFADYVGLLVPLTFFTLLFIQLDFYNKVLYDAVFGTFLQEFFQRILILLITLLFVFNFITLHQFILFYAVSVCAKGVLIFVFLVLRREISFSPNLKFIDPKLKKEMIDVAFFNVLTGLGGSIVFNIDKIIINQMLGLSDTGVYTIAFFFGTLVVIPSRPLLRISGTLIADAFKRNDLNYIYDIYRRSCINQFIIGAFIFGGIWINIENILIILGPDYIAAKWVIFFIGIGYLIEMVTGANGHIIAYSEHYRIALYFLIILIFLVIITMFYLIPVWGITGAAFASAFSLSVNNFMRYIYLKRKYKMEPFNYKFIMVIIAFLSAYFIVIMMPVFSLLTDIIIKSTVFTLVFGIQILLYNISSDVNTLFIKIIGKTFK
jgi:O-antigen/teichoic acid export membrane protein